MDGRTLAASKKVRKLNGSFDFWTKAVERPSVRRTWAPRGKTPGPGRRSVGNDWRPLDFGTTVTGCRVRLFGHRTEAVKSPDVIKYLKGLK